MAEQPRSWAIDRPVKSPFALPNGVLGGLAGRIMLWTNKQAVLLGLLDVRVGDSVLEVGYGPGGLVRLLVGRTEAGRVYGVDPSPTMRDLASRVNRDAVRSGRVELRVGTADRTGLADQWMDLVVSVNNVAIWPDLRAGVRELHRVTRDGGRVFIAWHGGTAPSRIAKNLSLPDDRLARMHDELADLFSRVIRHRLTSLEVFEAHR